MRTGTTGSDAKPFRNAGCYVEPQASVKNESQFNSIVKATN
jgi:hypothetical protein